MWHEIYRNGAFVVVNRVDTSFTDAAVQPDTQHSYQIRAWGYYNNVSAFTTLTVRMPPVVSIDPRQTGLRPLGTYWGSLGEQIDTRSGNVHYSLPMVKAMVRNGWSVTFAVSYNSQMWRNDPGGTWKLGRDTGFGVGWRFRLPAASLTKGGGYRSGLSRPRARRKKRREKTDRTTTLVHETLHVASRMGDEDT